MSMKKIFLSYRRDDVPGYVARLEDDLEQAFGKDRVFRDVEDIDGGADWREVIDRNLREAAALVLVIGRHWEEIWRRRQNDLINYVELELERARELGVAVIPVFMEGASLSPDLELGKIGWLRDKQFYEISDKQGRWDTDVEGLIDILGRVDGLERLQSGNRQELQPKRSGRGLLLAVSAVLVLASVGWWFLFLDRAGELPDKHRLDPSEGKAVPRDGPVTVLADLGKKPVAAAAAKPRPAAQAAVQEPPDTRPSLSGRWINEKKGIDLTIRPRGDGRLRVTVAGKGTGTGRFVKNMPGKFRFQIDGVGNGEFSTSNSDDSLIGWFVSKKTGRKAYTRLQKVE